jgi:hypothetical protein
MATCYRNGKRDKAVDEKEEARKILIPVFQRTGLSLPLSPDGFFK